ncbi:MAG: flagellar hook-length control protein FliK, partial [Sulfuricurvum sp.]
VSVPAQPVSVPAQPVSVQAQPVSVPAQPVSVPAQPVSVQAQPVSVPAQPVSVPAQPVSVPAQPVSVQAQPVSIIIAVPEVFKEIPKTATVTSTNVLTAFLRDNNDVEKSEKIKEKSPSLEESPKLLQVHTQGSIEVKSKEAVQSLSHFATDLKEAAENYKPPFTRITMKLNPEKLGEVEVTLVQRGNNIHVNIQSPNASSITFLAQNAMELRTQLAQQGVSNATMNFMSGGENQSQNPNPQQQQQQNRFQAYKSLSDLESNGEQLSALEIILPHYA